MCVISIEFELNEFVDHYVCVLFKYSGLVSAVIGRVKGATEAFVAELRRRQVPECVVSADLRPDDADGAEKLFVIMCALARMCRFDRTGDTYLITAIRAMLPSSVVASLEIGETPYAASKHGMKDSNERIGALYKCSPVEVLADLKDTPFSMSRLSMMMALAAEYLPLLESKPPLFINTDIGPAHAEKHAIFVCTNFDCGDMGDTVVVISPHGAESFTCVSTAVLAWAQSDPRAHELYRAVTDPDSLDPASVFRRV